MTHQKLRYGDKLEGSNRYRPVEMM